MKTPKNFMPGKIILDASFLVGLFDQKDIRHPQIVEISAVLKNQGFEAVYFDFTINEVISVICKRFTEQKRPDEIQNAVQKITETIGKKVIFWTGIYQKDLFDGIVNQILKTNGAMNFNDATMVLLAERFSIRYIASFDKDFDDIGHLTRIKGKDDVPP